MNVLNNLIEEALQKRGKFAVIQIIKNSNIKIWCETPGYNWEREYKIEATIQNIDGKGKDWMHSIVLTKPFDQYSAPGTKKELTSFRKILAEKIENSK